MLDLNLTQCLGLFKVYRTTYYNRKNSTEKEGGRLYELKKEDTLIKEKLLEIVEQLCYTPGSRTFYIYLIRDHGLEASICRIRRLMDEVHLIPLNGRPPSYKGKKAEGTHGHPCAAVENLVCQDFYLGPRKIILTDITYLYTNEYHRIIYLCVFYDCYTKEALGWAVRKDMTTALVQEAYDMMKERHGSELRGAKPIIHSDQGSQYTSTTFQQLLSDDGFLQSMSERGNSQDNAPMESFFGRMKEKIMNLIALCPDFGTAQRLICGFLEKYNTIYQFNLAGLSPNEFYLYTQTRIYPLPVYFGVEATELDEQKKLIDARLDSARKRNAEERAAYREKREREQRLLQATPAEVIEQDKQKLERMLKLQEKKKVKAVERIESIKRIIDKTKSAIEFVRNAAAEVVQDLKNPLRWGAYPELEYVYDMNGMY